MDDPRGAPLSADPIKILLHDRGVDVETPWAIPVPSPLGRTFVRLDNVPFLHAKPTFGDVIEVVHQDEQPGFLSWDAGGRSYDEICASLVEDGGRFTLIVDYRCDSTDAFASLSAWASSEADLVFEGLRAPTGERPGRLYVAAPCSRSVDSIFDLLTANPYGFSFELIHPR